MKIVFKNSFLKELKKLKDEKLKNDIYENIVLVENAIEIKQIKNFKKLKDFEDYYRLKIGNYRIGIKLINNELNFVCFEHRKDIYKKFP